MKIDIPKWQLLNAEYLIIHSWIPNVCKPVSLPRYFSHNFSEKIDILISVLAISFTWEGILELYALWMDGGCGAGSEQAREEVGKPPTQVFIPEGLKRLCCYWKWPRMGGVDKACPWVTLLAPKRSDRKSFHWEVGVGLRRSTQ